MATRGVSLTIQYVAWDTASNAGKTGDAANHTLRWIKDGTAAAPTNSPSEVDATNAPGVYSLTLTATETDCNIGTLAGTSSTGNVSIIPVTIQFERLPDAAPGSNGGLPTVDASNYIAGVQGTKNTLDDLNDLSASDVWTYSTRTLTQAASSIASVLDGGTISARRAVTFTLSVTGLGSLASRSNIYFTGKISPSQPDSDAMFQVAETGGLLVINGGSPSSSTNGSITVDDEAAGDITITIAASEMAKLDITSGHADIKLVKSDGTVSLLQEYTLNVTDVVTLKTS